jgi:hypothetical protein
VVIPTVIRPSHLRAVGSIFDQAFDGTIQVLIGIDNYQRDEAILRELTDRCPSSCLLTVFDLSYSTSSLHGGLHPCGFGGDLRTILSYAANSRLVAYLDDDNWWADDHLESLRRAIKDFDWAFSLRWFVDEETGTPLCVDEWESVGPGAGAFRERFGGFVDTNCVMIDKVKCEPVLRRWSYPLHANPRGRSTDRNIFHELNLAYRWNASNEATAYYTIQASDGMDPQRRAWIRSRNGESLIPANASANSQAPV